MHPQGEFEQWFLEKTCCELEIQIGGYGRASMTLKDCTGSGVGKAVLNGKHWGMRVCAGNLPEGGRRIIWSVDEIKPSL